MSDQDIRNFSGSSESSGPTSLSKPDIVTDSSRGNFPSLVLRMSTPSASSPRSTALSFAERMNREKAKSVSEHAEYRVIGMGTAGTVFEMPGTAFAIKKGSNVSALFNDFCLTNSVFNAFSETREALQDAFPTCVIPKSPSCQEFWMPDLKEYWSVFLIAFQEFR